MRDDGMGLLADRAMLGMRDEYDCLWIWHSCVI